MQRSYDVHIQSLGIATVVFHRIHSKFRVIPVPDLKDTSAGHGVIDTAMLVMRRLEKVIDVLVLRHIALDKGHLRMILAQLLPGVAVDISHKDVCALLGEYLDRSSADSGCSTCYDNDGVL